MATLRRFGVDFVGDIPWGTHLCQFYETKEDLIDILVPYFAAGLRNDEFCMWVTSEPLQVEEAKAALRKEVPNLKRYFAKGQIEIVSYSEWYTKDGGFNADRVLKGWVEKEKYALSHGFEGLRLTGNTFWIERSDWKSFADYEGAVNDVIGQHRMVALCTYSLLRCTGTDVVDVVRNHVGTLIKQGNKWVLTEDAVQRKIVEDKNEKRLRNMLDNMLEGCQIISPDWRYLYINDAAARHGRSEAEKLLGRTMMEMYPGIEKVQVFSELQKCMKNRVPRVLETEFTFPNGSKGWFELSIQPVPEGIFILSADISERKRAEQAFQQASREWERTFDSVPDLIAILDSKNRVVRANLAMARRLGVKPEQCVGLDIHGRTQPPDCCPHKLTLQDGKEHVAEIEDPCLRGHFLVSTTPLKDEQGRTIGSVHVARDITERKRIEKALRESQKDLNRAQTVAKTGSWRLDTRRNELLWSDETYRIFGIPKGTPLTYEAFLGAVHPEDRGHVDEKWQAALRGEPYDIEHRIVVDGEVKWVREKAELEFDDLGELQGGFGTVQEITERKEMQEKLEQYTKRLEELVEERTAKLRAASLYARSLVEASMDPLVTISAEGRITDVNRATELATGFDREQLVGSDFSDYFTEPEKARAGYQQVFTEGFVKDYPLAIKHRSGKITHVLYNATVYRNEQGEIQGVFAAARDVTERKQAEEKLRAASLYARSLIEASLDPLVTISADGKITDVNKSTEEATGFSREQLIGSDFSNYFTEPEKARAGYQKVFTEGLVRDYPLAIRHKSGKITDVLYHATIFRNEIGEIQGVFAAARDVTERKQAETRIRDQAELLDKAHDAITVRDFDNCIVYWNKGAERVYGWTAEEIVGKRANEVLYTEETSESVEARKEVHDKGEWSGELRQQTKDGRDITVESRWTLMRDAEGNPKAILAINTDVTDKKMLETQMLRAQRMESIGTLASGIAHDLNNILTPITLSLQLLQAEYKDEETKKTLDVLEKSARRGAELVKQVLTFARGVEGERKQIQLAGIISEVERIIEETFPKSIEIYTHISPDLGTVCGDATQLHQVIMNLCLNARDAMPNGGVLKITAENAFIDESYARIHIDAKVGQYVVAAVSDNGVGIPPEFREKIFEPFFTTKDRGKGTGLGLSTATAITKSHHGFMTFYSEVGRGTTFKIYLPIAYAETAKPEVITTEYARGQGELILVVEDEQAICEITKSILAANGYRAMVANDGTEAVALYSANMNEVKVVLVDMAMPIMDGYMTIRALKKLNPKVKIIAVSGLTENGKLASIAQLTTDFLAKPYSSERLLKTIEEVIKAK